MNNSKRLVSVVLPFANAKEFFREAIESVLAQTYCHWELILVDDGSTDGSRDIALSYTRAQPTKIRCIAHPENRNHGVTRSRNLGAESSHGEYLAIIDADDVWLPGKLDTQMALMEAHPQAGLVFGPSQYWSSWNGIESDNVPPVAPGETLYAPPFLFLHSHPFGIYGAPCPSSFLLRRNAFFKVGGFVEEFRPETYQLYEDTAFLSKLYLTVPVFVTGRTTEKYRCHPDSIWNRTQGTLQEEAERKFYFRWLKAYLQRSGVKDRSVWRAVRQVGWMYWFPLPKTLTRLVRRVAGRLRHRAE